MLPNGLGITARRSVREDEKGINELVKQHKPQYISQYGPFLTGNLIETSLLAITVIDADENIVGFAAFSDSPPSGLQVGPLQQHRWTEWLESTFDITHTPIPHTIWCVAFISSEENIATLFDTIFHTCFATLHWVASVAVLLPLETPMHPLLDANNTRFIKLSPQTLDYFGPLVFACLRDNFIPSLTIRRARLEDHDDLAPLFQQQSEALTTLYGDYFLAELIEGQDDESVCLVAEVANRACGAMAVTSDVNVALLNECFDLSLYDNLLKQASAPADDTNTNTNADTTAHTLTGTDAAPALAGMPRDSTGAARPLELSRRLAAVYDALVSLYCCEDTSNGSGSGSGDSSATEGEHAATAQAPSSSSSSTSAPRAPLPSTAALLAAPDARALCQSQWPADADASTRQRLLVALTRLLEQYLRAVLQLADVSAPLPAPQVCIDTDGTPRILAPPAPLVANTPMVSSAMAFLRLLEAGNMGRDGFLQCCATFASMVGRGPVAMHAHTHANAHPAHPVLRGHIDADGVPAGDTSSLTLPGPAAPTAPLAQLTAFLERACRPQRRFARSAAEVAREREAALDRAMQAQALATVMGGDGEPLSDLADGDEPQQHEPAPAPVVAAPAVRSAALVPNAFAVVLYCLADALEPRALDFLPAAFSLFPSLDYCILTLPHTCPEHDLLSHFTPVPARPHSTLPHALYIAHRDALQARVDVAWASEECVGEVEELLAAAAESALQPEAGHSPLNTLAAAEVEQLRAKQDGAGADCPGAVTHDALAAVHGLLPAGSASASVFTLLQCCLAEDAAERVAFEREREERCAKRALMRMLPQPAGGDAVVAQGEALRQRMEEEEEEEAGYVYEDMRARRRRLCAFTIRANSVVVGVVVLRVLDSHTRKATERAYALHEYVSLGDLQTIAEATASSRSWCKHTLPMADVLTLTLNPLFRTHLPRVCRELMRLAYKQVLLVPEHTTRDLHGLHVHLRPRQPPTLPPNAPSLLPTLPAAAAPTHSLGLLTRKLLSLPRAPLHARIVLVGASDTALCAAEALLAHPDLYLPNITIVSPHGLPNGRPDPAAAWLPWSVCLDSDHLSRSGVRAHVRVVEDAVVGMDADKNTLALGGGGVLAYDCVAFATGLADCTAAAVGADSWRVQSDVATQVLAQKLGITYGNAQAGGRAEEDERREEEEEEELEEEDGRGMGAADADADECEERESKREGQRRRRALLGVGLCAPRGPVEGLVTITTEEDARAVMAALQRRLPQCAVVYGDSLRAVSCLGALLRAGVAGHSIIWAFPEHADAAEWCGGDAEVSSTLRTALLAQGVTLLPQTVIEMVRCDKQGRLARLVCRNTHTLAPFALACDLTLCAAAVDTHPYVFAALAAASAAYDGRLLVDSSLRVCGVRRDNVLAAGPLCKFSRRVGATRPLSAWAPAAMGSCLARAIVECVDAHARGNTGTDGASRGGKVDALQLLGAAGKAEYVECCGLQYLRAWRSTNPDTLSSPAAAATAAGESLQPQVLSSRANNRYCRLVFAGRAHELVEMTIVVDTASDATAGAADVRGADRQATLGSANAGAAHACAVPVQTLSRLVGLPSVLLRGVLSCEGDLVAALWSAQTAAMAHESVHMLRGDAAAALLHGSGALSPEGDAVDGDAALSDIIADVCMHQGRERSDAARRAISSLEEWRKSAVRACVWEFVKSNIDHLPGYAVHKIDEQT